ncbi:hypothetical protein B9479_001554 [Cryptococcus floricola]|uniref:Zn(2)-C6 fungal-type domain-containing protein n=1 Tax=Cryptococcus floricola TaxID=2591691 RepID=A0A5D3B663_9TREE|nr:hypothetical protein B9479_001554 [Cryptococcus floricola]
MPPPKGVASPTPAPDAPAQAPLQQSQPPTVPTSPPLPALPRPAFIAPTFAVANTPPPVLAPLPPPPQIASTSQPPAPIDIIVEEEDELHGDESLNGSAPPPAPAFHQGSSPNKSSSSKPSPTKSSYNHTKDALLHSGANGLSAGYNVHNGWAGSGLPEWPSAPGPEGGGGGAVGPGASASPTNGEGPGRGNRSVGYGTGPGKSRKSSCANCHHRKIKQRPACASCVRKGHNCKYLEEDESYRNHQPLRPAKPLDLPTIKYLLPQESNNSSSALLPSLPMNTHVEITSRPGSTTGRSTPEKPERKKKKDDIREKILNGYDTDSEEETPKEEDKKQDVDVELAALVENEIDELADDGAQDQTSQKRSVSVDDDINGELLELASGPPKKKKKKKQSMQPPLPQFPPSSSMQFIPQLPLNAPLHHRSIRAAPPPLPPLTSSRQLSVAAQSFPPTPGTSNPIVSHHLSQRSNSNHVSPGDDPYSFPLQNLALSLPTPEAQGILLRGFWSDPILTEGIALLQSQFHEDYARMMKRLPTRTALGDATTLALLYLTLACALRIMPEDTSRLLLAAHNNTPVPRSLSRIISGQPPSAIDPSPLDHRYLDHAEACMTFAKQWDTSTVMTVMYKLVLWRYHNLWDRDSRNVSQAAADLASGIKSAQLQGLGKEWHGLQQADRELRRRIVWALYSADRHESHVPYTIVDVHLGINYPTAITDAELFAAPLTLLALPTSTDGAPTENTAFLLQVQLVRRLTSILDAFATIGPPHVEHERILSYDATLDGYQESLPPAFRVFPVTDTRWDAGMPFLPVQRVRLHAMLFAFRTGVHRTHLGRYLQPQAPLGVRQVISSICLSALRVQRSAKMLDPIVGPRLFSPQTVFENSAVLCLILYVDKMLMADVALASGGGTGPRTVDFMSMRSGVADALELLDMTVSGASGSVSTAKKGAQVVRAMINVIDAPLDLTIAQVQMNGAANGKSPVVPDNNGTPNNFAHEAPPTPILSQIQPTDESAGHPGNGILTRPSSPTATSTAFRPPRVTPPGATSTPGAPGGPGTPIQAGTPGLVQGQLGPHAQKVISWITAIQGPEGNGMVLDGLLKEPNWAGAWDRVVGSM